MHGTATGVHGKPDNTANQQITECPSLNGRGRRAGSIEMAILLACNIKRSRAFLELQRPRGRVDHADVRALFGNFTFGAWWIGFNGESLGMAFGNCRATP